MDPFAACVAFGPLAIYLVSVGLMNLARRPVVVGGARETLALGVALGGLVVVGPLQLFMPLEAAAQFGAYVWLLMGGFYALSLILAIILSRPRLVVYGITPEQLRPFLEETVRRLDGEASFAGQAVNLPLVRIGFHVESFPPLANVSLIATSYDQSATGWRRLETALRERLQGVSVRFQAHGFWLALAGLAMLTTLALWVSDDPQAIAQGFSRMLNP